ncbi:hypothetical protein QP868_09970 [Brevibacterium sp. UMB1308A]|nr:hypothetical protein [Brevibacterium sp. UMB1308A]MDK8347274.1 hypothetical protein [Brevibacterium sp. UMB1308B]MDK8714216.1 hypothetical protein [Brevibacterium sp. UMB1308A]
MNWDQQAQEIQALPGGDLGEIDTAVTQLHELLDSMATELDGLRP